MLNCMIEPAVHFGQRVLSAVKKEPALKGIAPTCHWIVHSGHLLWQVAAIRIH